MIPLFRKVIGRVRIPPDVIMQMETRIPIKETGKPMVMPTKEKTAPAPYGISLGEWLKFAMFFIAFYSSVRITQHEVQELKVSFAETRATIEEIRKDLNQVKLTNAVLIDEYNNDKTRRIEQLEKELRENAKANRSTH